MSKIILMVLASVMLTSCATHFGVDAQTKMAWAETEAKK